MESQNQNQIKTLEKKIQDTFSLLTKLKSENDVLKSSLTSEKEENANLKDELETTKDELDALRSSFEKLQQELDGFKNNEVAIQGDIEKLIEYIANNEANISSSGDIEVDTHN